MVRTENWNGHEIRFVWHENEWWAVLGDITKAMHLHTKKVSQRLPKEVLSKYPLQTMGGIQEMLIVNEYGIYETIFESRKKEAKDFKRWVFEMLKQIRQATGLEGFQIFRMLDKEHQKEAMERLRISLRKPTRVDYIKANTIANKAVSNMYGLQKMAKKKAMTPDMLLKRQQILDDTVELMSVVDRFGLDVSVSQEIYKRYTQ